jgi:limonene-1,2-epoxide hydrolase
MTSEPIHIAETFLAHWNANRIDEAIATLSEDVLYENVPFPDIVGRENVRKFHADFGLEPTACRRAPAVDTL